MWERPALPPYPKKSNALDWVVTDDAILFGHSMELWVSLNGAIDCIEMLEGYGVLKREEKS